METRTVTMRVVMAMATNSSIKVNPRRALGEGVFIRLVFRALAADCEIPGEDGVLSVLKQGFEARALQVGAALAGDAVELC